VLGYSRPLAPEVRKVNVGNVVDQVLALRRYPLGRAAITVSAERPPGRGVEVRSDERALAQALLNLVLNAEEALAGQPERRLRVSVTAVGPTVQVQVHDSGAGVPSHLRDRIFEPYFTTRESEQAVGLGLPVTRAIAESLGGRLWLDEAGPGATFVLELPRAGEAGGG
jgi:C4-dicarboxylate-specific signal transduction histidine kinase